MLEPFIALNEGEGTQTGPVTGAVTGSIAGSSSIDTDGSLAANSDAKVATQKAVKTYADAKSTAQTILAGKTWRIIAEGLDTSIPTAANTIIGTYTRNANERVFVAMFLKDDTAQTWNQELTCFWSLTRTTNANEFVFKIQNTSGTNQHADYLVIGVV